MDRYKYIDPTMLLGVYGGTELSKGDKVRAEVNINIATIYEIYGSVGMLDESVDVAARYLEPIGFESTRWVEKSDASEGTTYRRKPSSGLLEGVRKYAKGDHEVGGSHYKMAIEPWDFIYANNLDFDTGNIVKYACRHKQKNGAEDIKKIISYAKHILKTQYGEGKDI